jgi:hypothetical protein
LHEVAFLDRADRQRVSQPFLKIPCSKLQGIFDLKECARFRGSIAVGCADGIYLEPTARVLKNKHQAVSQGGLRFGKRSICIEM